ncbi:methylcobalamin:coenzyme M methyltransferase [bacterium BMS3Bbin03]|nr:methylcobalamin:coenzyme M methyltransferase [bacterium BMS3Bbin03]
MTSKERVEKLTAGEPIDRVPFEPAIYEHKAFLIGKTPSEVARSGELLYQALLKEHMLYGGDFLVAGLDVYNVEAEALGSTVRFFDGNDVPAVSEPILEDLTGVKRLTVPDPETAGRMPLFLRVAEKLNRALGDEVVIRGAVSGPFSLASELFGMEKLLMETFTHPDSVAGLLEFSTQVILAYADAFLDRGAGVVVFDSRCAPPLISPGLYETTVLPFHKTIMTHLKNRNQSVRALIIGGDTIPIDPFLAKTGANILLADFTVDPEKAFDAVSDRSIILRANLDPFQLRYGDAPEIEETSRHLIERGLSHRRFIMGTGVVPFDTPPERVKIVRDAVLNYGRWP